MSQRLVQNGKNFLNPPQVGIRDNGNSPPPGFSECDQEAPGMHVQADLFDSSARRLGHLLDPLESELRALPKIDLHAHLSGCIRLSTVCDLLVRQGILLPTKIASNLREALSFRVPARSYAASFTPWRILNKITHDPKVVGRLVMELAEDFSKDGVIYSEVRVSPRLPLSNGELSTYLREIKDATLEARRSYGIDIRVILGLTRNIFMHLNSGVQSESVDRILKASEPYRESLVVGFDLWGNETRYAPRFFSNAFRRIREAGYPITIHAGESGSSGFVREAIEVLGARRIGHACLAVGDPEVLALMRDRKILVEACITSNWITRVIDQIEDHAAKGFIAAGIPVAFCTDNTLVYSTTLSREFAKAVLLGLIHPEEIPKILHNSARGAFGGHLCTERLLDELNRASTGGLIERILRASELAGAV